MPFAPPFEDSNLPAHPQIEKAYGLIGHIPEVVDTALILFKECPHIDPEVVAGHMLAFYNPPMTFDQVEQAFSARAAEVVQGIKDVYLTEDETLKGKPHLSPDEGVRLSFLVLGILELETAMKLYGDTPLDNIKMAIGENDRGIRIDQDTVGNFLNTVYDHYTGLLSGIAGSTSEPQLERRFAKAVTALETKLQEDNRPPPLPDHGGPDFTL